MIPHALFAQPTLLLPEPLHPLPLLLYAFPRLPAFQAGPASPSSGASLPHP